MVEFAIWKLSLFTSYNSYVHFYSCVKNIGSEVDAQ